MRILIVDDNRELRDMISDMLELMGHTAVGAADGREALAQLTAGVFSLIICDLQMPDIDGVELINRTRHFSTPLVVMSGSDREQIQARIGRTSHTAGVLCKPFSMNELKQVLEQTVPDYTGPSVNA